MGESERDKMDRRVEEIPGWRQVAVTLLSASFSLLQRTFICPNWKNQQKTSISHLDPRCSLFKFKSNVNHVFHLLALPVLLWREYLPALTGRKPEKWILWKTISQVSKPVGNSYGRKSADRTKPHFDVIFFVFLSTYFGNLEVCCAKTFNIFWKYMSARLSTYLCFDQSFIGGLFNYPYILPFIKKLLCFKS